jgi:spore coat protein U-like protein
MKNTFTIGAFFLMLTGYIGVFAQGSSSGSTVQSATALITVNVVPNVELRTVSDLNFGSVGINTGVMNLELADPSSAQFVISGLRNAEVSVSFTASENLSGPGNQTIPFEPIAGYKHHSDAADFTIFLKKSGSTIQLSGPANDDLTGTIYLSVSGSLDVGRVPAGTYSGIITVSAAYQ